MKTRIVPSAIVGGYDLISNRTDKVLVFGETMTVVSNIQEAIERDVTPVSEAVEVASFIASWL